ncbi:hypothetical protein LIER_19248 [Lithospermum erythrorhizon]|uniref:hAT-like transposase RNase-H fold domain-containing protein n=1 Tax=Lithospermum erythrorhizon TaxID=34254 RepID=A0AAV3QMK0_LITER
MNNWMREKKHVKLMAHRMAAKYDKYWGHCDLLLSFGSMLDPRYKKGMIAFVFNDMFPCDFLQENMKYVETKFEELYNQYAKIFDDEKGKGEAMSCGEKLKQPPIFYYWKKEVP